MTPGRITPLLTALAVAGIPFASATGAAQEAPAFAGTWTLNVARTEPPKDKVIQDVERTGAGGTMGDGLGTRGSSGRMGDVGVSGGGGSRGGGGGGGGARSGGGAGGGRGNFRLIFGGMVSASKTLKVAQADSILTIDDEDGPVFLSLRVDSKTLEEPLPNGTVIKTKAQWKKDELVVERSHDSEGSARMIIHIDPKNPKQLIVDFHYEHKRQRRTIDQRRYYDAGM